MLRCFASFALLRSSGFAGLFASTARGGSPSLGDGTENGVFGSEQKTMEKSFDYFFRMRATTQPVWYTAHTVRLSGAARETFSDVLVNLAWVLIVTMPDYLVSHDWLRLTNSFFLSILILRAVVQLRSHRK
jgi:hypothetical protein